MRRRLFAGLAALWFSASTAAFAPPEVQPRQLPAEARQTLRLIDAGGPFPYKRDGITFKNREQLLPRQARGYYREYTVPTPGARDRGARRIVTGGSPPVVYFYTPDHYRTFQRIAR